jgi:integrase
MSEPRLIESADVFTRGSVVVTQAEGEFFTEFNGGTSIGPLPTLYDGQGQFVIPVNTWLHYLKSSKHLEDLWPNAKGLLMYWSFLEANALEWDIFPVLKSKKPTTMFRGMLIDLFREGGIARTTAENYMRSVIRFYSWAIYEGFMPFDKDRMPFQVEWISVKTNGKKDILSHTSRMLVVQTTDLRLNLAKESKPSLSPLEQTELSCLKVLLQDESVEFRLMCYLALNTGMRIMEVITFTEDLVMVPPESMNRVKVTIGPLNGVATKKGKVRDIEVPAKLMRVLKKYLSSQRRLDRENKGHLKGERFKPLFLNRAGKRYNRNSVEKLWSDLRIKIKKIIPSFNHIFHHLRATYGTYYLAGLMRHGIDPSVALNILRELLGHDHESTTWKYITYLEKDKGKAKLAEIMDQIIGEALDQELDF